jgi:uncharacterized RDD family membrane protein YckC
VVPVLGGIVFLLIKPMAMGAMLIAAVESFQKERPASGPAAPSAEPLNTPPVMASTQSAGIAMAVNVPEENPAPGIKTASAGEVPPVLRSEPPRASHVVAPEEMLAMQRAGFWPRFGATLLDLVLVIFVTAIVFANERFFALVWFVYHVAMWTWRGTTLGGIVFSLRIIRLDGRAPDFTVCLVRSLGSCLSLVVAGLGFFWASWNPEKQSWHDMIAGTVIVRTPRSVPLV